MAQEETKIVNAIMLDASRQGARLFKNVRGLFYTKDGVLAIMECLKRGDLAGALMAFKRARQVSAGVQAPGASDLIGFRPLVITTEMVGQTVAVFSVVEVKTATGAASSEQSDFIDFVLRNGGYAGVARSPEDGRKIMHY